jgi:23S rRNA (adenine2503-C2)-methyltransferase
MDTEREVLMDAERAAERADLLDMDRDGVVRTLTSHFAERGQPRYRTDQVLAWLYERDALSFGEITDLPAAERSALGERFGLCSPAVASIARSEDGTVKHLWRLDDGELVESVLIPAGGRLTLCLSSQAGCAMACVFCATGWSGYRRQMTAGEIVSQFRGARRWAVANDAGPITNVVFMGMGEPLANRAAVMRALRLLNVAYGFGARRITISTVGVVPGILELAGRPEQFRLAVSLHAPNAELRGKLVPLAKKHPLPELMEALRVFDRAGGRRITFEYVMIRGVNDDPEHARELADLVREFGAHVNLIPYNPIPGADFETSTRAAQETFAQILQSRRVRATIRGPRGRDIGAACGQLRADHETRPPRPYLTLIQAAR